MILHNIILYIDYVYTYVYIFICIYIYVHCTYVYTMSINHQKVGALLNCVQYRLQKESMSPLQFVRNAASVDVY